MAGGPKLIDTKKAQIIIGLIPLLLPFILVSVVYVLPDPDAQTSNYVLDSISHYFHSKSIVGFVGALFAVAMFFYAYRGYTDDKIDERVTDFLALCAIGIAIFPTNKMGEPINTIAIIHYSFAALFFILLAYMSYFRFTKTNDPENMSAMKKQRNKLYKGTAIFMLACIVSIPIVSKFAPDFSELSNFTFLAESLALFAFGIAWLAKGELLMADR